ncbi:amino acid adenylation domain-containing protein [Tenacibaculum gallaicum]|uniref:Amino acid adenylation domain-containing protein n=1 Tax=Tenacibaculum gallaicum TaxID=561505 RepID=A0A3E0I804_9FLAO|nr:non-ribosomal peptide synthetase [Tenacibaculum gallaicum]REH54898.1 amino acid adenylation domain-containing protein [Tenacibaculum gallaicum]
MDTIKEQIKEDYWSRKVERIGVINTLNFKVDSKIEEVINLERISYFLKISNSGEAAEYTILLSVFNALLNRYFEVKGVVSTTNLKDGALLFVLSTENGTKFFKEYLNEVKNEVQKAYKYSNVEIENTFDSLVKSSLYSFTYNSLDSASSLIQTPFNLHIEKTNQGLSVRILFDEDFVSEKKVYSFFKSFENWLVNLESYIDKEIRSIPLVFKEERSKLLKELNNTSLKYNESTTLVTLFEKQVFKSPKKTAFKFKDEEISYQSLNNEVNRFARFLIQNKGVQSGDIIGIKLKRNEKLLTTILGVLKVGGTYVPIDINYPKSRIEYILTDSKSKLIIDDTIFNQFKRCKKELSPENLDLELDCRSLAYIIYTSGTTGNPKGVMITHFNAVALIKWAEVEFDDSKFSIVYAATSHCFDLSIFEMFYALSIGKKIRLLKNALDIKKYLNESEQILINTVPSVMRSLIKEKADLDNVRVINLAGEKFPVDITEKLFQYNNHIEIRNLYGPSEDTTYSTVYKLSKKKYKTIPIGRPIANTEVYVLDDYLQLVPIGVNGKLYLSGYGLSNGYLNRKDLSNEKFIVNPFKKGKLMYDTGDLVRWNEDGVLEFVGRRDNQVKLNGYRIELEEIENVFVKYSDKITQVVVDLMQVNKGSVLIGYYVGSEFFKEDELKKYLKTKLPSYMIPGSFVKLKEIPLNSNGKIDKKALSSLVSELSRKREYIAPKTPKEIKIAKIWQSIIGIEKIGVNDSFFDLGGHSLMISQVINKIYKELNRTISFKVFYKNPTIQGVIKNLKNQSFLSIDKAPKKECYKVTFSQLRVWVLSQLHNAEKAYNVTAAVRLSGELNIQDLSNAFQQLIDNYEILRTAFILDQEGQLKQYILKYKKVDLKVVDFSSMKNNQDNEINNYIQDLEINYNFETGNLYDCYLFKLNDSKFILYFSAHHIIIDGWSLEILVSKVLSNYEDLRHKEELVSEPLEIQFKDYSEWLNKNISSGFEEEKYWLQKFKNSPPVLELPSFKKRPLKKTFSGEQTHSVIEGSLLRSLKQFSSNNEVTLFMTLMSVIKVILYKYSNQSDITVGIPIAGREHLSIENQIGLFVNTLAIRSNFNGQMNFLELLDIEREELLEAYSNQNYPFDLLVKKLDLERDLSRSPLFDVMVVLQNQQQLSSLKKEEEESSLKIEKYHINRDVAQFDISFVFSEYEEELTLEVDYNTDIYEHEFIQRIHTHLNILLHKIINKPDEVVDAISLVEGEEKEEQLSMSQRSVIKQNFGSNVLELFEDKVQEAPSEIAIEYKERKISYKELDVLSNELANFLLSKTNINVNDIVVVSLERSEWLIISILAVLKTGGAYCPVDPDFPDLRKFYIKDSTKSKVVLDEVFLNEFLQVKNKISSGIKNRTTSQDLAYVIFTSGSTGTPKGVMVSHASLTNFLEFYNLEKTRTSLTCNFIFDVSVMEIFSAITSGSILVIPEKHVVMSPREYASFLYENKIKHCYIHPMHLEEISMNLSLYNNLYLERILIGVEGIKKEAIQWYFDKKIRIINGYGPTEATICSSFYEVEDINSISTSNLPIGIPLPNYQLLVLEENTNVLVPKGVIGELCISGAGLAKGYLNDLELTKKKFQEHPFVEESKIYRTGDLVRWLPSGNLEFIGRRDHQVKIRGYRIELEEIEQALLNHPNIKKAVVLVKEQEHIKDIVSFIVGDSLPINDIREFLSKRLANYMLPTYYAFIDEIPLTTNGKIDKKLLLGIDNLQKCTKKYIAPSTELEIKLVKIWEDTLEVKNIGVIDNFFELGGHSLKSIKLINKIEKELNYHIKIKEIFAYPTIKELVTRLKKKTYKPIEKVLSGSLVKVTSAQKRLWILSQFDKGSEAYNIPGVLKLEGTLNVDSLKKSIYNVIERHESLRTYFVNYDNGIYQKIKSYDEIKFEIDYLCFQDYKSINDLIEKVSSNRFDLSKAPLLKLCLASVSEEEYYLIFNLHHIIGDGWSMEVFIKELTKFYNEEKNELHSLNIQYKDYANWLNQQVLNNEFDNLKEYWLNKFANGVPVLELPTYQKRPLIKTYNGARVYYEFSEEVSNKLELYLAKKEVTLFMLLMAGLNGVLSRYTGQTDIVLGTPVAGREHPDLEGQIGLYLNTLAIRTSFDMNQTFEDLLRIQKENLIEAYEHQFYPFDTLIDELKLKRDPARSALFDVMVVLQDEVSSTGRYDSLRGGVKVSSVIRDYRKTSQFDITFSFINSAKGLSVIIEYNTDLYTKDFISRLGKHLENFFKYVINDSKAKLNEVNYLSDKEKYELVSEFNNTKSDYQKNKNVVLLFEEQVIKSPNNEALIFEDKSLTYFELDELSTQLSNYVLQNNEIKKEDFIGVKLERSEWSIISILAVLKLGAAYVPIDINYPQERIEYIESDTNCKLTINEEIILNFLVSDKNSKKVYRDISSSDLAYVMYTSGSTGKPKGVMIPHKSIMRLVKESNYYHFTKEDVLLSTGAFSFDATTFEYWGPLLNGGKLILSSREKLLDSNTLKFLTLHNKVNIMWFTSGWFNQLVDDHIDVFERLSTVLVGGEKLSSGHIKKVRSKFKNLKIINGYGPTENTTFSLTYSVIDVKENIPIGYPVSNSTAYILDSSGKLLPIGCIGEIYLGGDGLAKGYLNFDSLTNEKFITNPFNPKTKLYKTGDLGKRLLNGSICFERRIDNQVKIRGHRIELGEIENVLSSFSYIANVVVILSDLKKQKVIVAYLTTLNKIEVSKIRRDLKETLPDYMIPNYFIFINEIPLTPNGKVDRKALPAINEEFESGIIEKPKNETERKVQSIWESVLGVAGIGVNNNFFELGGHSLSAAKLINEYKRVFKVKLSMKLIFTHTSIRDHAQLISNTPKLVETRIPKAVNTEYYPITSNQKNIWVASQYKEGSKAYHMSFNFEVTMNAKKLEKSIEEVIKRYEILRTVFVESEEGKIYQRVLTFEELKFRVHYEDYRHSSDILSCVNEYVSKENETLFSLETGPLMRVSMLRVSDLNYMLYVNIHHIICDAWSIEILINEILNEYKISKDISTLKRKELPMQFKDYSSWKLKQDINCGKESKSFWMSQLQGELPKIELSISNTRPRVKTYNGGIYSGVIDTRDSEKIFTFVTNKEVSLYMHALGVLQILLYKYSLQNDIIIGSPTAGRNHSDLKDQIGCFINTVAIRLKFKEDELYETSLKRIKNSVLKTQKYQDYPFYKLLNDIQYENDPSRSSLFDIMLVMVQSNITEKKFPLENTVLGKINKKKVRSKVDLTFFIKESNGLIETQIVYNLDLYTNSVIDKLYAEFETLLITISENNNLTIGNYIDEIRDLSEKVEQNEFSELLNETLGEDF